MIISAELKILSYASLKAEERNAEEGMPDRNGKPAIGGLEWIAGTNAENSGMMIAHDI